MNLSSWLVYFLYVSFIASTQVFSADLRGKPMFTLSPRGNLNKLRTTQVYKGIRSNDRQDKFEKLHFLAPAINSLEALSKIKNLIRYTAKCSKKLPRCQVITGISILTGGCIWRTMNNANASYDDLCNIIERYGSALATTASICVDYRLQQVLGFDIADSHNRSAVKLGIICSKNGGLYIKAAQYLSSMDHLLPDAYINELKHLQDQAPASSLEFIEEMFKSELKKGLSDIFSEICQVPIGSASIGQVHLARLKSTAEEVAVKIQHPNIKRDSSIDLMAFSAALKIVKLAFPSFDLDWLIDELRICLDSELNFRNEAFNSKLTKDLFEKHHEFKNLILIPKVYDEYTTERILTMQYIPGCKINDIEKLEEAKIDPQLVNKLMYQVFMEMIFKHQFVHCDPHPGNILINRDPKTGQVKIVLLDHGIYKKVSSKTLMTFSRLFLALLTRNQDEFNLIATELKISPELLAHLNKLIETIIRVYTESINPEDLKDKLRSELLNSFMDQDKDISKQASDILKSLPREIFFLIKILDLLRSNERSLIHNVIKIIPDSLMIITGYALGRVDLFSVYKKLIEAFFNRKKTKTN